MRGTKDDTAIVGWVADNVRDLRRAAELSQEELAHQAGLDRTYISQVERKRRNVTVVVLARIARALKVPAERLVSPHAGPKKR